MSCGGTDTQTIINDITTIKNGLGNTINITNAAEYQTKQGILNNYQRKIRDLEGKIKDGCFGSNSLSNEIVNKQRKIKELNEKIKDKEHDIDVAKSRHEAITSSQKKPSYYQGLSAKLGFTKPIKKISVSILIALGIFLSLMSIYMIKTLFGEGDVSKNIYNGLNTDSGTFDKKAFLYGAGLVGIIVSILSFLGYYGKSSI